jgi:hypothetical protein
MDLASFLFGVALGLTIGGLVAWLAGRVTTARILARLDAERQGSAEKLARPGASAAVRSLTGTPSHRQGAGQGNSHQQPPTTS